MHNLGILDLKNCKRYRLSVYPDSFPSNSNSTSNWNDGLSTSFTYTPHNNNSSRKNPATSLKIIKDIQSRKIIIDLEAIATFTCSDILIEISTYRSILLEKGNDLDSNGSLVYNKTHSLQEMETLLIDDLQPCSSHRLKISIIEEDKHVEIFNQNFKTELGVFDGSNDTLLKLEKSEVILELNDSSSKESDDEVENKENLNAKLIWADKCVDSYKIKRCRVPLECSHERFTFLSTDSLDNKVTRFDF